MSMRYVYVKDWLLMLAEGKLTVSEVAFLMDVPREDIAEWAYIPEGFSPLLKGRTKPKQRMVLAKSLALFLLDRWHNKAKVARTIGVVPFTVANWDKNYRWFGPHRI